MKRKTSALPTRIYTYGCRLPTANGGLVEQQILLAHRYYNKLIEIERRRRTKVRTIQREAAPDVVEHERSAEKLDVEIAQILAGIKERKAEGHTAKVEAQAERARVAELRAKRKEHYMQAKAARAASKTPEVEERMRAVGAVAATEVREARAACGVYWGTYLTVEAAVEAAKKCPTDPEFRRWSDGAGRVAVQIQNGIPVAKMFGGDTRVQLDEPAPNRMSKVRLRVGTNPDRSPVFAEFPFRYHRPLPADARIKWAWISKSLKGRWVNWDLQIVLEAASFARPPRPQGDGGAVAIDIGWRLRPGRDLRVGYWLDDRGQSGELLMPADLKQRLEHADSLRSIQDLAFDQAKAALLIWREGREAPEWLATSLEFLPQWRGAKRLGRVVDEWSKQRFDGDVEIVEALQAWWKQHRHLYDWEQCERDRALAARKNLYREWAEKLTRQYAVVVLEDFDLREVAKRPAPDATRPALPKAARRQRQETAPSEFVAAIKSAAPGNGCTIAEVECAYTTQRCSRCGHVQPFDHASLIKPACERCGDAGHPIDQDREAAANLLAAWVGNPSRSQTAPEEPESTGLHPGAVEMPAQGAVP